MQFVFPVEQIGQVNSLFQIKRIINSMLVQQKLSIYCAYKFQLIRSRYIYCRCKGCSARLVFRRRESRYVLFKSNYNHQHKRIRANKFAVIQAIQNFPASFNILTIKNKIMNQFNLSAATFYRRYRESQTFGKNLIDVLTFLQNEGIFGVCINSEENQELPELLLLTSEPMIESYYRNGKRVNFDLTYNLIRQKSRQQQQYSLGVFLSTNNNLNIQPHCLVIMGNQSKANFIRTFTEFFNLMKSPPQCVFTDQQKNIQLALEELQERSIFNGYHFIDIFHVLRNVKKSLFHKPSLNYFLSLSRSSNIAEYNYHRELCHDKIGSRDEPVLKRFEEKMKRCCLALIPPIFVGLSCTTACSEKINDLIKTKIPYSQKYITVVSSVSKLLSQLISKRQDKNIERMRLEKFTTISEIQSLRKRLNKRVFRKLMFQLSESNTCLVNRTQTPNTYQVIQQNFEDTPFHVIFNPLGKWECECRLNEKIGIPCTHILKIILLLKEKIITSIDSWWLLNDQQIKKKPKMNYPRKTRRCHR